MLEMMARNLFALSCRCNVWRSAASILSVTAASFAVFLSISTASASQNAPPAKPKALDAQGLRAAGLEAAAAEFDSIGLRLHLPLGADIVTEKYEGRLVVVVSDRPQNPTWSMRIQTIVATDPVPHVKRPDPPAEPTAASQVDDLLFELEDTRQDPKVLSNQPVTYGGVQGQLVYVQRQNESGQAYVSNWLVLPTGPRLFLVFALQTLPEHLPRIQPVIEASYSTIALRNAEELASEKQHRIEAGRAFIESLTPDRLKDLVGQKQWHRIYRPANGKESETEVGYSLVEVLESPRGAINPDRPTNKYTTAEKAAGLMVRVQARLVVDAQRRDFYDSMATYWMAWDQSEETWSIVGTRRQADAEISESETGVREKSSQGGKPARLNVIKRAQETEPVPFNWEVPDVYLSQALGWLAGRLFPREGDQPRHYAYYFFVSSNLTPKVYLRLDEWSPSPEHSGQWLLKTQFTSDTQPFISVYASDGSLVRRTHADGTTTVPITLEDLRRLYQSKGLNIGATPR